MKKTTKFIIHRLLINTASTVLLIISIVPLAIAAPFHWMCNNYINWCKRREAKLLKKYNLEIVATPDGKEILREKIL